jgi:hypothetical protein
MAIFDASSGETALGAVFRFLFQETPRNLHQISPWVGLRAFAAYGARCFSRG